MSQGLHELRNASSRKTTAAKGYERGLHDPRAQSRREPARVGSAHRELAPRRPKREPELERDDDSGGDSEHDRRGRR